MDEIKTTLFPTATRKAILAILELHGARLEICEQTEPPYCLIGLPVGTRREYIEALTYHKRFINTLPDGFKILQMVDQEGWSSVSFPTDEA